MNNLAIRLGEMGRGAEGVGEVVSELLAIAVRLVARGLMSDPARSGRWVAELSLVKSQSKLANGV